MKIEIWSDIVCPFCYIGKRKFEKALDNFAHKENVEVIWRSFQLDPNLEFVPGRSIHQYLADRKGVTLEKGKEMNDYMTDAAREVGLEYHFDKAILNNTMDAHRLLHFAAKKGLQNETKERLFAAYYTEGLDIGNREVLVNLAAELGMNAEDVSSMLESNEFANEVKLDQLEAEQSGASGVPFFVINNKYAISGAQPTELFAQALNQVWEEEKPLQEISSDSNPGFCSTDGDCL